MYVHMLWGLRGSLGSCTQVSLLDPFGVLSINSEIAMLVIKAEFTA